MRPALQSPASRVRTRSGRAAVLALGAGLLVFAGAAQADTPADYPAADVLATFATVCGTAENQRANVAVLEADGWERLSTTADTPVTRLVTTGKAALSGKDVTLIDGGEYRKVVAGLTLYVALSGVAGATGDSVTVLGCRLFDFDAPRAFSADELGEWSGRTPTSTEMQAQGVHKITYNPGLKPGHLSMEIYFVPPGANPLPGFDLRGLSLVASVVEF